MRAVLRAGIALCAWFAATAPRVAGAQEPEEGAPAGSDAPSAIVVAGLRPAADGYTDTEIMRLSHAQKVRELVDEAVHDITQRVVLNHGALRAALGQRYMVEFFACKGDMKCVARMFAKVRDRATLLVYGDYSVKKGNYRFRMRLIDLAGTKLLSEVEFSLNGKDAEDAAVWNQKLKALLQVIAPAGGGETGGGETGGGETGGGETGGGETGGGETGGGTGRGTDELTDADFGDTVEQVAVAAPKPRTDLPWITLATVAGMTTRWFDFETAEDNEVLRPPGYTSDWTAMLSGSVELYPFAWLVRHGFFRRLGLAAEYGRSDTSAQGGRETNLYLGANFMVPIGTSVTNPTFGVSGGFLRHDFVIVDEMVAFPSVSYRGAQFGLDARVPIGSPRLAFYADVRYMWGVPKGAMFQVERYGASRVGGFDLESFLEIVPVRAVFIRLGAHYSRFSLEFDGDGDLSDLGSVGAQDKYLSATVSTGLRL